MGWVETLREWYPELGCHSRIFMYLQLEVSIQGKVPNGCRGIE